MSQLNYLLFRCTSLRRREEPSSSKEMMPLIRRKEKCSVMMVMTMIIMITSSGMVKSFSIVMRSIRSLGKGPLARSGIPKYLWHLILKFSQLFYIFVLLDFRWSKLTITKISVSSQSR